jgi:hypothetical protein
MSVKHSHRVKARRKEAVAVWMTGFGKIEHKAKWRLIG